MTDRKYGAVYTPDGLADFVAALLRAEMGGDADGATLLLDPACGECALLKAAAKAFGPKRQYVGIDIDQEAIAAVNGAFTMVCDDAVLPRKAERETAAYWRAALPPVSAIIANPPWSATRIYEKDALREAGFSLGTGQYDSYVLFIELAYALLTDGGYFAFILPDSLFDAQNERLRRFLSEKTHIKVIARLGEKIFEEVNRAASVLVCRKSAPDAHSRTTCFRLTTEARRAFLAGDASLMDFYNRDGHQVSQSRFLKTVCCNFDIDTRSDEEALLAKLRENAVSWEETFLFGRGVELSKSGRVVYCPHCGMAQGYLKKHLYNGGKTCGSCGRAIPVTRELSRAVISKEETPGSVQIYVGENVQRYRLAGESFILPDIPGINYKNRELYAPPKLLIRKTGLGIYCAADYTGSMTSQTVYILKPRPSDAQAPLTYYLALLNSRVIYYFYLKMYGENEWKSHPYLTKKILFSLPVAAYTNSRLDCEIAACARSLSQGCDHEKDMALEALVMDKYGLSARERALILSEMNRLPDLTAVNCMKAKGAARV